MRTWEDIKMPKISLGKRVLVVLAFFLLAAGVYAWFFGEQTFWALSARNIGRKVPLVKQVPVEIGDLSVASAATKSSHFGYDFQLPWDDLDEQDSKLHPKLVVLSFHSGLRIMIKDIAPKSLVNSLLSDSKINRNE